jgi:hypothetical protein
MVREPVFRKEKTMSRKILIVFVLLALTLSGCGALKTAQAFTKVGNEFMTTLRDGNYETAYSMLHPNLQAEIGTAADLQKGCEDNAAQPKDWSFSSINTNTDANKVTTATMEGSVNYQDGKTGTVSLELAKDGEAWKIISFSLNW